MMISTMCAQNVIVHADAEFAASELYVHLKKICNQEYSIVTEKEFAGDSGKSSLFPIRMQAH